MMLSAADDNDIREAFDVLDDEKDDYICLERLELLILGLGFADRVDVDVLERQLSEQAVGVSDKARIPLETVLRIVETYVSRKG
jgi:Ca2+-binding EF-hand superfamily protein